MIYIVIENPFSKTLSSFITHSLGKFKAVFHFKLVFVILLLSEFKTTIISSDILVNIWPSIGILQAYLKSSKFYIFLPIQFLLAPGSLNFILSIFYSKFGFGLKFKHYILSSPLIGLFGSCYFSLSVFNYNFFIGSITVDLFFNCSF